MSGHSKWSSIKHKKAAKDAKRGKLFTKLIKEITVAARGGADPNGNPRLRTAVLTARAASLPNDTIERAIKKGSGQLEGQQFEEIDYEGYGPGGVAVMVRVLTDNRNRTVSELRFLFGKHGGNLGEANSVAWMFHKRGVIHVDKQGTDEDRVMEVALEAGAEDVSEAGDLFEVTSAPDGLEAIRAGLERAGLKVASAEVTMVPSTTVHLTGAPAGAALKLLEAIEDHDDVQSVSANLDIDPAELEKLSAA
ncbi:MAG: YebC/PmpR family DNA-binding transcriptional regulator [Deltaproteobacteria bacterium]|nr:YebC/PmpR family DNA-binding transcriptional regulator [Deltaproteobacteria bacterium]